MKKTFILVVLFGLVFQPGLSPLQPGVAQEYQKNSVANQTMHTASGIPGWPLPNKPIPHHEPGHLSRAGSYTTQVSLLNAEGIEESVQLSGLDAMAADGVDPFAGNYTLVSFDQVLRSGWANNNLSLETLAISDTISTIPGSQLDLGNYPAKDLASGDLNNDGQLEQIVGWIGEQNHINLSIGEVPGISGKTTSAPAAVVTNSTIHLLVRGYDEALWHCQFDVDSGNCINWDNSGGGILLSAPAVASLGEDQFDAFAVLTDNQVYWRHWQAGWSGDWQPYGIWPAEAPSWSGPTPELPPLAAVARDGGIDLFRLGPDHTLYWHDGSGWQSLGGMLASGPGAVSLSADTMQVFALGMDEVLWTLTYDSGWGEWQRLPSAGMAAGVSLASAPVAISPVAGEIIVYARGSDNQLWSIENIGGWGEWSAAGGELASGPGAVVWSGTTYLFAQKYDDLLQSSSDALNWTDLGGLTPCCTFLDTGFVAQRAYKDTYQDYSVNLESGYFFGDGRSQMALAYFSGANQVSVAVFENGQRFQPDLVTTTLVLPQTIDYFNMTTGDFLDGDGIEEIALAYVRNNIYNIDVIKVTREGLTVEVTGTEETVTIPDEDGDDYEDGYFSGTLGIASGDFDRDGQDEIGLITVWHNPDWIFFTDCDSWLFSMRLRIYDLLEDPVTEEHSLYTYFIGEDEHGDAGNWWGEAIRDEPYDVPGEIIGLAIAAGDVDGDGKDELVNTEPAGFNTYADSCYLEDEPVTIRFVRNLVVNELPDNPDKYTNTWDGDHGDHIINNPVKDTLDNRAWSVSYQDRLVVGDLNRDLQNEIVWQMNDELRTYYHDAEAIPKYKPFTPNLPLSGMFYPEMVAGAFTGDSVRVGPPSYRVQNRVDTLVAMINMPPVHRDLVKDDSGDTVLVETPQEVCVPSPDSPDCTHAKYGTLDFTESEELIETKHEYSVSAGMESKTCASGGLGPVISLEACTTISIDYTHGGMFDSQTDNIFSITYNQKVIAADDDKIVYYGTPYAVWEYPLLTDEPGETPGYITVVSPLISQTRDPSSLGGYYNPTCDEEWYSAGHIPDNVWSYDPIGAITFEDYDPARLVYDPGSLDDWFEEEITYSTFQQTTDSQTFSHSISAGLESETSAKADLKIFSVESNFKKYIKGSYKYSEMETDRFTTQEGTTFSFFLSPKPLNAKYTTRPILYWANAGHIVLDYQAEPGQGSSWLLYDKPDPAFMLPWYGFPNPEAPENPPCGSEKKLFSHDVIVDPAVVSAGETVTITAVVRNFSNVTSNNVRVRFCLGDPGAACNPPDGSAYLGESIIPTLRRPYGPETVSIQWAASGVGRQKIYAVIDPNNQFDEVHDEDDLINNNVAYGLLDMGTASFFDMGQAAEKLYESQIYSQTQTLKMSVYIPLDNLPAVTRFDLKGVDQKVAGIGNPIKLIAYQGEIDWATPENEDYYLAQTGSYDPPAVITVSYVDADLAGRDEGSLKLYRLGSTEWEDASRTCGVGLDDRPLYETLLFPEDNLIAVPVCQTGTFVLADKEPSLPTGIYLPLVIRN